MSPDDEKYGVGFEGFQRRIEGVTAALGGGVNLRIAVADDFKRALVSEQRRRRASTDYRYPDWTEATPRDFDYVGTWFMSSLRSAPQKPLIATADWNGAVLELYEDAVYLRGGEFRLCFGLISEQPGVYQSSTRSRIDKWSPFITDTAARALSGSEYGLSGNKSVSTKSLDSASKALRKLFEKHFKVTFVEVSE